MKKTLMALMIIMLFVILGGKEELHPLYLQYQYPNEQYFGADVYSEILYEYSEDERTAVNVIMETAEEIFSYVGPKVVTNRATEALERYYPHLDIASEEHVLELITVTLDEQSGVMWVAYSRQAFDNSGNLVYGAGGENEKILARWELEQIDGIWIVVKINEAP